MTWRQLRTFVSRSVTDRAQLDGDLDEEIRFHLAQEAELQEARGATAESARHRAQQLFGSTAFAKENTRAIWGWTTLEHVMQDLRFGFRILTRSPALSLPAIVLVALVVGGNTTLFTIVHSVLKKPAAGVHADRLATFFWVGEGETSPTTSYASYRDFMPATRTFESVLAVQNERLALRHQNGTFAVSAGLVSPNYFDTLGVGIAKGRGFTSADAEASSPLVAVISHRAWQAFLGGSDETVGSTIMLEGHPATVIGIAEPPFRGALLATTSDVWVPLVVYARESGQRAALDDPLAVRVSLLGRLKPGVSLTEAKSEAAALLRPVVVRFRERDHLTKVSLLPYSATADGNTLISRAGDQLLALVSVVSLLTLCVVCANVANLLVARGIVRRRETALRQSLGASRLRIVRMLVAEGAMIATLAGIISFVMAWWVARLTTEFVAPSTQGETIILPDFTPDWPVAMYAVALAAVAVLAFTLLPALRVWQSPLQSTLRIGELSVVGRRSRLTTGLVVVQLALCVLLLVSAGIAYRSSSMLADGTPALDPRNGMLVTVNTSSSVDSDEQNQRLLDRISAALGSIAGVEHVAFGRTSPLSGWRDARASIQTGRDGVQVLNNWVSPEYLEALGVSLLAGAGFSIARSPSAPAAIVNQALAKSLWPSDTPIGRTLRLSTDEREIEVVGLVPDVAFSNTRREGGAKYALINDARPFRRGDVTFVVRSSKSLDDIAPQIRRTLLAISERTPIVFLRSMQTQRDALEWPGRFVARLLMLFAVASLLIATIGQYAAALFDTRRRIQEFGLRMALGASAGQVRHSVLREGAGIAAAGLAIGFGLSLAVSRVLQGALAMVKANDPLIYLAILILLTATSLIACYLPARRATLVDPVIALRHE